ncbi:MAG: ornithine cyclodeaminase family protein [Bdellovibrionota bacterium]
MNPVFFSAEDLERRLEPAALREALRIALASQSAGSGASSPRFVMPLQHGALGAMFGVSGGQIGGKLMCIRPENRSLGLNPHQGIAALFDPETGACLCLAEAERLTALRTAAVSAAATAALSRPESRILTVVGSGEQAYRHVQAILPLRSVDSLRIAARNEEAAKKLAARFGLNAEIFVDPLKASRGADILCLCTSAQEPYLKLRDLSPGIHVNAVGACRPGAREIDLSEGSASFFVDSIEAAREEAEELRSRFAKGMLPREIGAVFAGETGRTSAAEITVFKSGGIGIEDTAALALAFRSASP